MAQLKLELLKEEARDFVGPGLPPKVSLGAFFKKVIEIEDHQYVLVYLPAIYHPRLPVHTDIHSA